MSYATFVGYDEVAHHSGIREPDALDGAASRHDRQLARLERAIDAGAAAVSPGGALRPRPDAGRAVPPALRRDTRGGRTRGARSAVRCARRRRLTRRGATSAPCLADAREEPSVGRAHPRARHTQPDRSRARSPWARTGRPSQRSAASAQAQAEQRGGRDGLRRPRAHLPPVEPRAAHARADRRGTSTACWSARRHTRIGFVMVRSAEHGALVIGGAGRRRLSDDAVEGEDPLAGFRRHGGRSPAPPRRLPALPGHPRQRRVRPRHGRGRPRSRSSWAPTAASAARRCRPFAVVPAGVERARPSPIVGVEAMHEVLREWLAQSQLRAEEPAYLLEPRNLNCDGHAWRTNRSI